MKKWKNIKVVALAAIVTGFLDGTIHGAFMDKPTDDLSSSNKIKTSQKEDEDNQQIKAVVELSGILDHFEGIETESSATGEAETLKRVCSQKVKEVKRLTDEAMQVLKDKGFINSKNEYLTDQPDHTGATEAEKAIATMKKGMIRLMALYAADIPRMSP